MRCRRAKSLIFEFIDGMIGDQNRIALEQHLNECPSCESMAQGLSKSLELLHKLPSAKPHENFTWKVRLRIAKERNTFAAGAVSQKTWLRAWNARFALSALSTFAVVLATGYFVTKSLDGPWGISSLKRSDQAAKIASDAVSPRKTQTATRGINQSTGNFGPTAVSNRPGDRSGILDGGADLIQDGKVSETVSPDSLWRRERQLEDQVRRLRAELLQCKGEQE